jgi:hypothetical protein
MTHCYLHPAAVVVALALFTAGCATPPPKPVSSRDASVNFATFKTFGWAGGATSSAQPVTLLDQNVRAAITTELTRRGYVAATEKPDLLIAYDTASAEKLENNPVRVSIGIGSWGSSGGGSVSTGSSSVRKVKEGSLVIHAVDASRNAEVWQGSIAGKLGQGSVDAATVNRAVATAMKDFPAGPAAAQ